MKWGKMDKKQMEKLKKANKGEKKHYMFCVFVYIFLLLFGQFHHGYVVEMSAGSKDYFNCFPSCIFTFIASRERERKVRPGESRAKEKAQERQQGRKKGWICAEEVEGGRMMPKQLLINTQGTNACGKHRNKYSKREKQTQ